MQKNRPVSRLSMLRPDFMMTQDPLPGSARAYAPADPLYPVPARLLAQLIQFVDESRRAEGKGSLSNAEIRVLTGRDDLDRTIIRQHMDEGGNVGIPADYVYELSNHITAAGTILNELGSHSSERDEAIHKLKLQFMNLFFEGIRQDAPKTPLP